MTNSMFSTSFGALTVMLLFALPALAFVHVGTGDGGLLGGDLTDPKNVVVDTEDYSGGTEEQLKPPKSDWVSMKCSPTSPPGTIAHQQHPYQSWQNSPACAIFLNKPSSRKWYVGFKDGGRGGPTEADPYYAAVELKSPAKLTHFTITTSPDMPGRDPKTWAIQGSNTGEDNDWTDIYRCDATGRGDSPLRESPRCETTVFTSFNTLGISTGTKPADGRNLKAALKRTRQKIEEPDFPREKTSYKWFRIVITSCFNANSLTYDDFNRPPGFALGQVEFFGLAGGSSGGGPWQVYTPAPAESPMRTWTSKKGDTLKAKFMGIRNYTVKLAKPDGSSLGISLLELSEADQKYLEELPSAPGR